MAGLAAITSERINDQPKIFALLPAWTSATVRLFSVIQALPKRAGEYHMPPNTKAETAAANTAIQLTVLMSIIKCFRLMRMMICRIYFLFFTNGNETG